MNIVCTQCVPCSEVPLYVNVYIGKKRPEEDLKDLDKKNKITRDMVSQG